MKRTTLLAIALMSSATAAFAAPTAIESFTGLNPGNLGASTSTLGAGTWSEPFAGPPNAVVATSGAAAGTSDASLLTLNGEDLQLLSFTSTATIAGTTGPALNTAFLFRVNSRPAANAQATIDIITMTQSNDAQRIFSIGLFEGDLGLSYNRYFQGAEGGLVLNNAADATTPVLTNGVWYVIAGRLEPNVGATGTSKWWIYPAGSSTPLSSANGVVVGQGVGGTAFGVTGLNNIQYGQKINDPFTDDYTGINVSVDQVTFFDSAITESNFLTEVQAFYGLTSVSDWSTY